jgi:hypothetical protein
MGLAASLSRILWLCVTATANIVSPAEKWPVTANAGVCSGNSTEWFVRKSLRRKRRKEALKH